MLTAQRARQALLASFTLPDEQLEHLAEQYLALPPRVRAVFTFEAFLVATPQVRESARYLVQIAVRLGADQGARDGIAVLAEYSARATYASGPRVVEKLRHHRHPRGPRRYMAAKEES